MGLRLWHWDKSSIITVGWQRIYPQVKHDSLDSMSRWWSLFFVYFNGIWHVEFLPWGQTVNSQHYRGVLQQLREKIRKKRPELWRENSWSLHHDNACSLSLVKSTVLCQKSDDCFTPPSLFPRPMLAPYVVFLVPKIKSVLKGCRFHSIDDFNPFVHRG